MFELITGKMTLEQMWQIIASTSVGDFKGMWMAFTESHFLVDTTWFSATALLLLWVPLKLVRVFKSCNSPAIANRSKGLNELDRQFGLDPIATFDIDNINH